MSTFKKLGRIAAAFRRARYSISIPSRYRGRSSGKSKLSTISPPFGRRLTDACCCCWWWWWWCCCWCCCCYHHHHPYRQAVLLLLLLLLLHYYYHHHHPYRQALSFEAEMGILVDVLKSQWPSTFYCVKTL